MTYLANTLPEYRAHAWFTAVPKSTRKFATLKRHLAVIKKIPTAWLLLGRDRAGTGGRARRHCAPKGKRQKQILACTIKHVKK